MMKSMKSSHLPDIIAFWGYIAPEIVAGYKEKYPCATWVDLDINYDYPQTKIIPEASCKIIKNIFDNAFYFGTERIIKILAPIGKDKCDSAFFASEILREKGFRVENFINEDILPLSKLPPTPICDSSLPLKEKVERITAEIIEPKKNDNLVQIKPRFGFWGVPPNDLSILELFPNETQLLGWCRCVEAKNPANIKLEMFVPDSLPVIFYAQTFCAKNQLAKYLADKHNGLYIDVDGWANNSTRAKIEAFLQLR